MDSFRENWLIFDIFMSSLFVEKQAKATKSIYTVSVESTFYLYCRLACVLNKVDSKLNKENCCSSMAAVTAESYTCLITLMYVCLQTLQSLFMYVGWICLLFLLGCSTFAGFSGARKPGTYFYSHLSLHFLVLSCFMLHYILHYILCSLFPHWDRISSSLQVIITL